MIVFDIECSQGHIFEGWFDSPKSFEEQNSKNLVSCPYCEDTDIRRVLSPVSVKRSGAEIVQPSDPIDYHELAKEVVNYIYKNSEDVGTKFTAEALKMHFGVAEKRNIRGTASQEEEKTLRDEGIEFFKFPSPKPDGQKN